MSAGWESLRSRTCVAPREKSQSWLWSEAVVMMGEKPDNLASWIAVWRKSWFGSIATVSREMYLVDRERLHHQI